jgi:ketosteroid isomerase-like protein
MSDPAAVIRRYFEIVADLGSSRESLVELLHPDVRVIEHPNAINPCGAVRDREAIVAGFLAGKALLAAQSIDILELLVSENRAAVRATWRGTIGDGTDALASGAELVADIAGWLTVEDGRIREHETFDCYQPLPPDARTAG